MAAQAVSGIAKDLTKMSSKSAIKLVVPGDAQGALFKWVAVLTGSKNALKGVGFFVGGLLLAWLGFAHALWSMAAALALILMLSVLSLPRDMGRAKRKTRFSRILSKSREINILSTARFFLFGARDVWFVVGLPVFLYSTLDWSFSQVGGFMALWVIGYGIVQGGAPRLLRGHVPSGPTAVWAAAVLAATTFGIAWGLAAELDPTTLIVGGLALFGLLFAINSAVHSFLILSYSDHDSVALDVGFYYMANAGGRLAGTLLSGWIFQSYGLLGCLIASGVMLASAAAISLLLPRTRILPAAHAP
jgi:hypothetical protein